MVAASAFRAAVSRAAWPRQCACICTTAAWVAKNVLRAWWPRTNAWIVTAAEQVRRNSRLGARLLQTLCSVAAAACCTLMLRLTLDPRQCF